METKKSRYFTFFEHLEELRSRIIKAVVTVATASCLAYHYVDRILPLVIKPVGHLVFTSPAEAFLAKMMLAFFGGLFLSMPIILYQIWQFVSVGLTEAEKKYAAVFIPLSFVLFILGCCFAYFVMLEAMLKFLLNFSTPLMIPMITVSKYISFVGTIVLTMGLVFELPLVIVFLAKLGIVTPSFLIEKRRHAIVLIFIVSAVMTPSPDVFSQVLMAGPLIVLYEISILFAKLTYQINARKTDVEANRSPTA